RGARPRALPPAARRAQWQIPDRRRSGAWLPLCRRARRVWQETQGRGSLAGMWRRPKSLLFASALLIAQAASAHVRLESPASRYGDEMKVRPCGLGGGQRTTRVTTVRPGQVVTMVFDEFIDHPRYS